MLLLDCSKQPSKMLSGTSVSPYSSNSMVTKQYEDGRLDKQNNPLGIIEWLTEPM